MLDIRYLLTSSDSYTKGAASIPAWLVDVPVANGDFRTIWHDAFNGLVACVTFIIR